MTGAAHPPPELSRAQRHQARRARRRRISTRATVVLVIVVAAAALAAAAYGGRRGTSASAAAPTTAPSTSTTTAPPPDNRNAIQKENDKIGTRNWGIGAPVEGISGYADRVSVQQGEAFTLYVSSVAPEWRGYAYRMGWYGGSGGRPGWEAQPRKGGVQAQAVVCKGQRYTPPART